jgi:hypothetical protein
VRFNELLEAGRAMSPEGLRTSLVSLASDPRFPAVLAIIEGKHREWCRTVAGQALAQDHGKLAHCAGSVFALENLLGSLKEILEPSAKRVQQTPPSE